MQRQRWAAVRSCTPQTEARQNKCYGHCHSIRVPAKQAQLPTSPTVLLLSGLSSSNLTTSTLAAARTMASGNLVATAHDHDLVNAVDRLANWPGRQQAGNEDPNATRLTDLACVGSYTCSPVHQRSRTHRPNATRLTGLACVRTGRQQAGLFCTDPTLPGSLTWPA
jgi:hypothetical protein